MSSSRNLIEVRELSKSFGRVRALDRISFEVREGEVMGFLGPNGAGKTTTLRILSGFLPGDSGVVRVADHDVHRESLRVRGLIGYLPEGVPLYPDMRVSEYLRFRARLKGVSLGERRRQIDRSLEAAGVSSVRKRIIGTLSRGYRQRVGLADALLNEPRVLILDEPTVGLDPEQIRQFRSLLREIGRNRTVILSTHILREVEIVCSSVVIISGGRIAAKDSAEGLRSRVGRGTCVVAEIASPKDAAVRTLEAVPGVTRVSCERAGGGTGGEEGPGPDGGNGSGPGARFRRFRVYGRTDDDLREVVFTVVKREGWSLRHLEQEVLSLEDVFLDIVGKGP